MATRADSDAETNVGGRQLGCCRRCGALVADTAIHKTLHATAAATAFPGRGGHADTACCSAAGLTTVTRQGYQAQRFSRFPSAPLPASANKDAG
jgi:hypothetical protein